MTGKWLSASSNSYREVQRALYEGAGQPELLKHELTGCWSRRINQEHRLIYQVLEQEGRVRILSCRYHY